MNLERPHVDEFILNKGSVLRVFGFNLEMNCNELISDEGVIETWPENSVYPIAGRNGRAGGNIGIAVQRARGLVRVNLRGEAGARGRDGLKGHVGNGSVPGFAGCRGQDGGQGGATGMFQIVASQVVNLEVLPALTPGAGGGGGGGQGKGYEAIQRGGFHRGDEHIDCVPTFFRGSGVDGGSGTRGSICQQIGSSPNKCFN